MGVRRVVLSTLLIALLVSTAYGARQAVAPRPTNPRAAGTAQEVLPIQDEQAGFAGPDFEGVSLGASSGTSIAPGIKIGDTWYDQQHNGSMGRMVDWGVSTNPYPGLNVYFTWTRLTSHVQENRHYAYTFYSTEQDTVRAPCSVQPPGEYAGYVGIDVTGSFALVGGHNNQGGGYQAHFYFDPCLWFVFFGDNTLRIPDSVIAAGTGQNWQTDSLKSAIWPKFRYQDVPGQDHVLHVFAEVNGPWPTDGEAIIYFRKVGEYVGGVWDMPPYVVDTVFDLAQDVACSNTDGKMALVWIANLPDDGDCDTCSSQTGRPFMQWDNDVYYQISYDYGATFEPRVNLTMNIEHEIGFRPYTDLSALIDSDDNLHIAYNARQWGSDAPGQGYGLLRGRMFHWGENLGTGGFDGNGDAIIRTAANLEWDQTTCNGGQWQLNGSKMSLSECDGKLYYLWTQFNDIPKGVEDDCHNRAWSHDDIVGSANGELYLAVSADGGMTWDEPRNLTNTYTPHCDSATGSVGRCQSEHWSSMARFGTDETVGSNVVIIDPSEGYSGDWFLDVQYIDDADPGSIIRDEGTWRMADVRWFRLPCVEPVYVGEPFGHWSSIDFPEYTKHGTQYDKPLTLENSGNAPVNFTTALNEDPGPYSGWLSVSEELMSGVIPSGTENTISGVVTINEGGTINEPGTIVRLTGNLTITGDFPPPDLVFPIDFLIVDTIVTPTYDTVTTGCFSLIVASSGNWGNQGTGHVNLDFIDFGDCDNLEGYEDTIPGDASIYVYDASPVICRPDGDSVLCNWSIYGHGYLSDNGFFPLAHAMDTTYLAYTYIDSLDSLVDVYVDTDSADIYYSKFATRDTGIVFEKWWIAPYNQGNDCNFIIQVLSLTSGDSATHAGLNIGEAVDWDIPSDTATRNNSGFDLSNRLVWQRGSEYDQDNLVECQENSDRFGGIELLGVIVIDGVDTSTNTEFHGAYTEDNSTYVHPTGGFVPEQLDNNMTATEGFVIESDSLDADIHSVMTYRHNYTLTPDGKLIVFSCLITGRIGFAAFIAKAAECHDWYEDHLRMPGVTCCMGETRGNVDYDPNDQIDINDLVYMVDCMFIYDCFEYPCFEEVDMNGDGAIDISDLVVLVDYMFTHGPAPQPCP